ncbi:MAG: hypothetical protein KDJ47_17060 [Hyphomicrobiaceae bacterium]|nr:hypothetical protein [Hyphomicrobiaceae bacterium]
MGGTSPLSKALQNRRPDTAAIRPKDGAFRAYVPTFVNPLSLQGDDKLEPIVYGRNALNHIHTAWDAMNTTAKEVSDLGALARTLPKEVKRVADKARKDLENINVRVKNANDALTKSIGPAQPGVATEIRAVFRAMEGDTAKLAAVREAIANYDATTIRALISAPAMLSGLSPEVAAYAREQGELLIDTQSVNQRNASQDAYAALEKAITAFESEWAANFARWSPAASDDEKLAALMGKLNKKDDDNE